MKATELRLGNYICNEDYIVIVESIDKDGCIVNFISDNVQGFTNNKGIEPIPLTEEWLIKFGFEKKEDDLFIIKLTYNNNSIKYSKDYQTWVYYKDDNDAGCNTIADCQYVHQLQNLYFALTNEELTMK